MANLEIHLESKTSHQRVAVNPRRCTNILQVRLDSYAWCDLCLIKDFNYGFFVSASLEQLDPGQPGA